MPSETVKSENRHLYARLEDAQIGGGQVDQIRLDSVFGIQNHIKWSDESAPEFSLLHKWSYAQIDFIKPILVPHVRGGGLKEVSINDFVTLVVVEAVVFLVSPPPGLFFQHDCHA